MTTPPSLAEQMVEAINNALREQLGGGLAQASDATPACRPLPTGQAPDTASALPALKHWSHPFGDQADPLRQLTQLAKAERGRYPLGNNGLWHLGVHFDGGTAGTQDQSHIRCLADGEVVAYRIDQHTPTTEYSVDQQPVHRPFSRSFVLVRHRLQAPAIEGSDDTPPSLTFYCLYMHLQDWAVYQADKTLKRPAFWPDSNTRRVKDTENDFVPGLDGCVWLRTRIGAEGGAVISGLARGTDVTISGTGSYRKLDNIPGPYQLLQDGALQGYVSFGFLKPIGGDQYRVKADKLNVRPTANRAGKALMTLPRGTEVTLSGDGDYRKLEWVNQYIHFDSLLSEREPLSLGGIVVLDEPVPIQAGELIGHLGEYQDYDDAQPRQQLHLEVFSGENVETFIRTSRAWAQHLPASGKTWLKLAQGTPVVPHQRGLSTTHPPKAGAETPTSAAELLLPKRLLDGLGAEKQLRLPAQGGQNACTWYHLDGLLHDAHRQLLNGWVKVEADAPWVSPWEWSGYAVLYNGDTVERSTAYAMKVKGVLPSEQDRARHERLADLSDRGPVRSRLFELLDGDCDGVITADELEQALNLPAHAQSIAQLVINDESEWWWQPTKWDAVSDLLGHSSSTPNINWLAEKQRIEQICWWNEVAPKLNLPASGRVWHLHPVGLVASFAKNIDPLDKLIRRIGDIISHGEGGYESYNTGTKDVPNGKVGFSFLHPPKGTVTSKTINEIIASDSLSGLNKNRMFATGKYQTVIETLRSAKRVMTLTGHEIYDEKMQERVFAEFLFAKAGGGALARFVEENKGSADDAQYAASKEWASIAAPAGRRISDGRVSDGAMSYYSGSANSANIGSTAQLGAILRGVDYSND
ncbi:hypothetical protein NG726_28000 [Pseudomonas sp. MOB-449]|nr:hypothetical protein [Pseudomonas sp. MOB-449]